MSLEYEPASGLLQAALRSDGVYREGLITFCISRYLLSLSVKGSQPVVSLREGLVICCIPSPQAALRSVEVRREGLVTCSLSLPLSPPSAE